MRANSFKEFGSKSLQDFGAAESRYRRETDVIPNPVLVCCQGLSGDLREPALTPHTPQPDSVDGGAR